MSRVYSASLLAAYQDGSTDSVAPLEGFLFVVRDIDVVCHGPEAANVYVSGVGTINFAYWLFDASPAFSTGQWRGRQVIPFGEALAASSSGCVVEITISGYILTTP